MCSEIVRVALFFMRSVCLWWDLWEESRVAPPRSPARSLAAAAIVHHKGFSHLRRHWLFHLSETVLLQPAKDKGPRESGCSTGSLLQTPACVRFQENKGPKKYPKPFQLPGNQMVVLLSGALPPLTAATNAHCKPPHLPKTTSCLFLKVRTPAAWRHSPLPSDITLGGLHLKLKLVHLAPLG